MHQKRAGALSAAVCALMHGAFLTVTALGRRLHSQAKTKHNIKRMDRLLSNQSLHDERLSLYRILCHRLCSQLPQPIILIDWSDIVEQQRLLLIRAALVVDGRAIPLYEAVYPLKKYNKPRTHFEFLATLKSLLPEHCVPIIVTDAGFRGPWFKAVESCGWFNGSVESETLSTIDCYPATSGVKPRTYTFAPPQNPSTSDTANSLQRIPIVAISI